MKVTELAWAAGVIEGEGWFTGGTGPYPAVAVSMTDLDIIERLRGVFGCGAIGFKKRPNPEHKDCHTWRVYGPRAVAAMMTIYSFMGVRRRARIKQLLLAWRSAIRRQRHRGMGVTDCPHVNRKLCAFGRCGSCYKRYKRHHKEPSLYNRKTASLGSGL